MEEKSAFVFLIVGTLGNGRKVTSVLGWDLVAGSAGFLLFENPPPAV